jgi:hypothetical protein
VLEQLPIQLVHEFQMIVIQQDYYD